jgi:hypothetical protein
MIQLQSERYVVDPGLKADGMMINGHENQQLFIFIPEVVGFAGQDTPRLGFR